MPFVQLSKISLSFGDRDILKDITLVLSAGTKAALTGANGCGKSTLMKIIAGLKKADSGEISTEKETRVSYLPQDGIVHKGKSLFEEAESAFSYGKNLIEKMDALGDKMANEKDEDKLNMLAHDYHDLQVKLDNSGWHKREGLIDEVLRGLGFSSSDFQKNTDAFSGGWQMRIALAKVLLENSDIIILDEPTNYLDIEARNWLEIWLKKFTGGFLLVSHDRYFLDQCVLQTYELFNGVLKKYKGSYSDYEKTREVEIKGLLKAYKHQQEEIARTEDFIRKFRYKPTKAAAVQDRIHRLEKMERIVIPEHLKKMHFSFPPAPHSGKIILQAENISKSYGDKNILSDLDLTVEKKERLVLVGKNGAGKSTLLRILAQQDKDFTGNIKEGSGVLAGYFSQDASETINGDISIIEFLEQSAPLDLIPKLHDMLGAFLFHGDAVYKSLSVLSGGEKSRLALLKLLLKPLNLLILDEPTNHLDLHSKDVLLEALQKFEGTVIFVSHDKGFIQNLATRVLELQAPEANNKNLMNEKPQSTASRVRNFPGTYDYYLYRIEQEENGGIAEGLASNSKNLAKKKKAGEQIDSLEKPKTQKLSYEEQKRIRSERRKLEKEESRLLAEIDKCEIESAELQEQLAKPEIYSDGIKSKEIQEKLQALEEKQDKVFAEWEKISQLLEAEN